MTKFKNYLFQNFEQLLVLSILAAVVCVNYFVEEKLALLNLFFLPSIVAGFVLGKRKALLTSMFCVTMVLFYIALADNFKPAGSAFSFYVNILSWGSFLILSSILVGHLHEENEIKLVQLKKAYTGILEILSKYIESADKYTQGHSVRVSHYATELATAMNLPPSEIENIKVAALLHDIGKVEISTELIGKAAALDLAEKNIMDTHTERGAQILSCVGSVLNDAIPLVRAHHEYFEKAGGSTSMGEILLGARILAVADSYDAMTTDRPYRSGMPPWKAIEELERCTGTQFDPEVVKHFKSMLFQNGILENMSKEIPAFGSV